MPAIARSDAVVMCFGAVMFSTILYMPLYLQLGRGMGIGASGALLLPITLAQVMSAAITGRLVTHTGAREHLPDDRADARHASRSSGSPLAVAGAPTAGDHRADDAGGRRPRHGDAAHAGDGADWRRAATRWVWRRPRFRCHAR